MCTPENVYQEFTIEGLEYKRYKYDFLRKVDQYYNQLKK
jgi:hypothetical protein